MSVQSFVGKMIMLTVVALFALSADTARIHAQGGSEASPANLPAANQPAKFEHFTDEGGPAANQTSTASRSQPKEIVFHHLTIDDGLAHNSVFDVLQDRQGFIWATTVQGINKYDGMTFTTFMPQASASGPSTPQFYMKMLEDRDGILWFCNYGAGLVRHDPVLDTWKFYQHDEQNPNSLVNNTTWFVFQDRDGILWVSTYGGLSRFDPETEQFANYRNDPKNPNSLGFNIISQITQDAAGKLWIGTYGGGLDKFDPATGVFTHYRNNPDNPDSLSDNRVESVWIDPDGSMWIGTDNGLNHFDPDSGHFVRYFHDENDPTSLSHSMVLQVMRDSRNQLWISTWGGGVNRFDEKRQQFIRYQNDPHNPDSLSAGIAPYFSEDRTGALWFGTFGGINIYDPGSQRFNRYQHLPDNPNSLPTGRVRAITQDKDGIFWIAMWDQGLVRFDRKKNAYTRYQADPNNPNSLSDDNIFDIRYDPRGWLWVATTAGLNKLDLATETWTQYHADPDNPHGLAGDWISGVAVDAHGDVWLAVYGKGLQRFNPVSGIFTRYPHDPNHPDSIANNNLNYVMVANDGMLWIGGDASVSRFDPATGKAVNFTPEQNGLSGLTSDQAYQDRQGRIWVATYSGVNKFDPKRNRFTPYPNIRAVLAEDAQGNLWVIAGKSLARFDPVTDSLRRYDEHDGLLSNALEPTAGYTSPSGEIFVGGAKGFNSFFPDRLPDNPTPPPVVLTAFDLLNKPVVVGGDSPLKKDISVTKKITLPYDYTVLTLKFAALNYRSPQKNQYAYMLEGFDRHWIHTDSKNRRATYTNLDPGSYTFRVKASNNDGVWNEKGTALAITITPPWWQTWWFRGVTLAALLVLLFTGYRLRVKSIEQRSRDLERQVAERTRELQLAKDAAETARQSAEVANRAKSVFLANMSHELRTPMNAILGYAQLMQRNTSLPPEQREYLNTINRSSEHLLALINDVLGIAKIEAKKITLSPAPFDLHRLLHDLRAMFRIRTDAKGLRFAVEGIDALPRTIVTDENKLRQVLINLLGNAVKFTAEGGITLRVVAEEQAPEALRLRFEVEDTGAGIAEQELDKVFGYFEQTASGRNSQTGTGLGMAISRDYARMLGGDITVSSQEGRGSLFRFGMKARKGLQADTRTLANRRRVVGIAKDQPPARILVAEDMEESRTVLVKLLESVGFQVRQASDGKQALAVFNQWQPDYIWMDVRLPAMDGLEATRRIKATEAGKSTIVAALTAHALEEEKEQILAAGCDDFVRKPYREQEIFEVMRKHLGLKYIYAEEKEADLTAREAPELSPEQLADLPADLIGRLYQAVVEVDQARAIALMEQIARHDAAIGKALLGLANNLDYGRLMTLLKSRRRIKESCEDG